MHEEVTRDIGGHTWTVARFTGRESLALFRTLLALAADPIARSASKVADQLGIDAELSKLDLKVVLSVAGGAFALAGEMAAKLSDKEFVDLAVRLLTVVKEDNKPVSIPGKGDRVDLLFQGDPALLIMVCAFVVEVNFIGPFVSFLAPVVGSAWNSVVERIAAATAAEAAATSTPQPSSETSPTQ